MGSSPLTRGKRDFARDELGCVGLIPAHAGKTSPPRRALSHTGAHPRSRGKNTNIGHTSAENPGSSPLTREKHEYRSHVGGESGLIPTHARKTSRKPLLPTARLAHPRSRWENMQAAMQLTRDNGSSPLTRGKHSPCLPVHTLVGLIPAHAGKTPKVPWQRLPRWAHPRTRGENCTRAAKLPVITGSSPLTRGKHHGTDSRRPRRRLIPTHARKTWGKRCGASRKRAHPRRPGKTDLY